MLDTLLIELIWGSGRRRVGLAKLQLTPKCGGMGAPDFQAYCYASQLVWLAYWIAGKNLQELAMTQTAWENGHLHKLLLPGANTPTPPTHLLKIALGYWKKATRYTRGLPAYAPNIPLLGIPLQSGVVSTRRLGVWSEEGVRTVGDFFVDGILLNHEEFARVHGTPQTFFLLHAQISRYIRSVWSPTGNEPTTHNLINMQYLMGNRSHITRWLYRGIREVVDPPLITLKHKWDTDLDRIVTDAEWKKILEFPRKSSRNPKFKFIQLMISHRAYLTPSRIHSIYPEASDECPRCHAPNAIFFFHMLWNCPKILQYWSDIHIILHGIAPMKGDDTPEHYRVWVLKARTRALRVNF